jgi:MFS family permease
MLEYPRRSYAWVVVAILIATAVLSFTDRQVLSLLVDPIRGDLSISDTQMSLLLGIAFALVYGAAGVPIGMLADRISRRNLIAAGVAVWSTGTIACGLSHDFRELFLSRIVVGLGEGALAPAAISLISDYFPPERRGTAVALFLSGIAMGSGVAILIGGAVLHAIEAHAAAHSWLAAYAPWRMVLLLIGAPGYLWVSVILIIREPPRRNATMDVTAGDDTPSAARQASESKQFIRWVAPLYISIAAASLVDNAVGAWAPTLLIRDFAKDPAQVGLQLGALLTVGFGSGVLIGGALADRAAVSAGWRRKLGISLVVSLLILPASLLIEVPSFGWAMTGVPLYFALSGIVTAVGFSAILDRTPGRSRGLAMSIAFFLNVAVGAGVGPTAVAFAAKHVFRADGGLGPPIVATVAVGYGIGLAALTAALISSRGHRLVPA